MSWRLMHLGRFLAPCRRFLTWWVHELDTAWVDLGDVIGVGWRRRAKLKPCDGGFLVTAYRGGAIENDYCWLVDSEEPLVTPRSVVLEVPDRHLLLCTLTFPIAARNSLASAVALKLMRESPLPVDQLICAIGPVEGGATPSSIVVAVGLLKRAKLESWRGLLAKSGISIRQVQTDKGWLFEGTNVPSSTRLAFTHGHRVGALTALLVAALVCIGFQWQQRMQREEAWLQAALLKVEGSAADDVALRTRLSREAALARDLALRSKGPDIVHFLEVLNERLPKTMWVQSFGAKGTSAHATILVPTHVEVAKLFLDLPEVREATEGARAPVSAAEERVEVLFHLRETGGP